MSHYDSARNRLNHAAAYQVGSESFNPYWQITETKSKTWEFTERHLRKQNPKNFQKFHFGNVTERHLRKQNPDKNTEYLVIIFIFLKFLGSSPSVNYGNKIQWNFPKES